MKINVKKPNVNENFDNAIKNRECAESFLSWKREFTSTNENKGNLLYKLNLSAQMMNLSSKFRKFKADNIVVIWSENIVTENTMDWWRFFSHIKNMIFHPKTSKIPNLQKWYQNGSKPII